MLRGCALALALLLSGVVSAAEQPFSSQAFAQLQQRQSPILVFIHADWCPTCNRQAIILSELFAKEEFKTIEVLRVDFDKQKSVVNNFGVIYQSTLIVFRGDRELGRSTADTDKRRIANLLRKAL
jgi:thioredoxin-like negative regulator of GroEL